MPLKWPSRPKCDANAGGRLINSVAHRPTPDLGLFDQASTKRPYREPDLVEAARSMWAPNC
jgi:hypothetical protein